MHTAEELIRLLDLKPLPLEGGYFRETYRCADELPGGMLRHYSHAKHMGTAIYYLLTPDTFSAMHRLPTEEVFHFYLGGPVSMLQLDAGGGRVVTLGNDLRAGQRPQVVVSRGTWQGSFLQPNAAFALLGTTMAPGFDFTDYEAGDRTRLSAQFPQFAELIRALTRTA